METTLAMLVGHSIPISTYYFIIAYGTQSAIDKLRQLHRSGTEVTDRLILASNSIKQLVNLSDGIEHPTCTYEHRTHLYYMKYNRRNKRNE